VWSLEVSHLSCTLQQNCSKLVLLCEIWQWMVLDEVVVFLILVSDLPIVLCCKWWDLLVVLY
jgi:hypothetical protein